MELLGLDVHEAWCWGFREWIVGVMLRGFYEDYTGIYLFTFLKAPAEILACKFCQDGSRCSGGIRMLCEAAPGTPQKVGKQKFPSVLCTQPDPLKRSPCTAAEATHRSSPLWGRSRVLFMVQQLQVFRAASQDWCRTRPFWLPNSGCAISQY